MTTPLCWTVCNILLLACVLFLGLFGNMLFWAMPDTLPLSPIDRGKGKSLKIRKGKPMKEPFKNQWSKTAAYFSNFLSNLAVIGAGLALYDKNAQYEAWIVALVALVVGALINLTIKRG